MSTVLFLSGFNAPEIASKSYFFFDENAWNCKTIFYKSKTPTSPSMVEYELTKLNELITSEPTHVIGHSLGAWWVANLACRRMPEITRRDYHKMGKIVLWTPLGIASVFPFFRPASYQEPLNCQPNKEHIGHDKTMVVYAKNDLIVPYKPHALPLVDKFQAKSVALNGGHLWQTNHRIGFLAMQHWLGVD